MWILGGALTGLTCSALAWKLASVGLGNADREWSAAGLSVLVAIAAVSGFLAGAAVFRRTLYALDHIALFSALSWATAGGVFGASYAVTLTAAYVHSYVAWPQDRLDETLLVLSYPAFGGLGLWTGACAGFLAGALLGTVLRLATFRRSVNWLS